MYRILADGFLLVTGRGKTYTKADLLADARGGKTTYERQDDSSQKVRVWGDTAVVTFTQVEKSKYDNKDCSGRYGYSDVWMKRNGRWQAVSSYGRAE